MRNLKKPASLLLISGVMLANSQALITYADQKSDNSVNVQEQQKESKEKNIGKAGDITPPVLDVSSLKVSKKEAKAGDRVTISFKASDDITGVGSGLIEYNIPGSSSKKTIYIKYNSNTDEWEGYIDINENTASGLWKIDNIFLQDKNGNYASFYNNLGGGDFIVKDQNINQIPVITANDIELKVGDYFHPLIGVSATDKEDGKIAATRIDVKENTVDTTKAGIYKVVYEVKDKDGNIATKEIKVIVQNI